MAKADAIEEKPKVRKEEKVYALDTEDFLQENSWKEFQVRINHAQGPDRREAGTSCADIGKTLGKTKTQNGKKAAEQITVGKP